ncbi:MAG: PAS domain S-box protein [Nitrospirae bacterium]|nr:PAS domain S-box protein [Candidatus Manganitrophaceae bacterium]
MKQSPQKRTAGAPSEHSQHFIPSLLHTPSALIVLFLTFLLTGTAWYFTKQSIEHRAQARFDKHVLKASQAIEERLQTYVDTLLSIRGLFVVNEKVSRADWKKYIESLHLKRYPGIYDIVFARYVPKAERAEFERHVRKDSSLNQSGYPTFSVHPEGDRPAYFPIEYIEPFSSPMPKQFGYDMGYDPIRRQANEQARDTGQPVSTGKITLMSTQKAGFSIRVPVYHNELPQTTVDERRRALIGFIAAAFNMDDFIHSILGQDIPRDFDFEIFDGGTEKAADPRSLLRKERLLYDSDAILHANNEGPDPRYLQITSLEIAGRIWHIYFSADSHFKSGEEENLPPLILLGGIIVSLLLSYITWSTSTARRRAIELAEIMTVDFRESEERFRAIFDQAPSGIAVATPDGSYVDLNERLAAIMGYTKEELLGRTFQDITHPEDLTPNLELKEHLLTGKISHYKMEKRYVRKSGQIVWADLTVSPIFDLSGKQKYLVAVVDDITRRKEAEEKLRRNEAQLAKAQEIARLGSWSLDLQSRSIQWSDALYQIYGLSPKSELTYEAVMQYSHPADRERVNEILSTSARDGRPFSFDYRIIRPDGAVRTLHAEGEVLCDGTGQAVQIVGTAQDITDRKEAAEVLRGTNQALQAIIESAPLAIISLDLDGKIKTWNPAAEQIFGWRAEEVIGHFNPIIPDDQRDDFKSRVDALLQGRTFPSLEVSRQRKDGSLIKMSLSTAALRDANGRIQGFIGLLTDRTAYKQAEEALRKSEARFRRVVDSNMLGIVFSDVHGDITEANDAFLQMVGYSREELQRGDVSWKEMTPPEYQSLDLKALNELIATGVCTPYEKEFTCKDGKRISVVIGGAFLEGSHERTVGFVLDITGRRRAEEKLRQSEEKYRLLFETNPHPMWVFDLETLAFLAVNEAAIRHYGFSREEFLSMTIKDHSPSEELPALIKALPQISTRVGPAGIWRTQKKDGTIINVEITSDIILFSGRKAKLVLANDVTERLRAGEAVKQSEAHLRAIIDSEPECVKTVSLDGTLLAMNPAGLAMIQAASEREVVGKNALELVHPEDRLGYRALHQSASQGESGHLQFRMVGLQGRVRWVETHSVPLKDQHGGICSVLSVTRDITERKQAEEALRETQRTYSTLISNLPGLVYRCRNDSGWTMEFISDGVFPLTGYASSDFTEGKITFGGLIHFDDRKMVYETVQTSLQQKNPFQLVYRILTASREEKWVWEQGRGVFSPAGELLFLEGFITDITEQKHAEEALQRSEEQYRLLFDRNPWPMWVVDPKTQAYMAVNDAAIRHYGYSREEFLRMTLFDIRPLEEIPLLKKYLADTTKTPPDPVQGGLWTHRKKDGTLIEVEITWNMILVRGKEAWLVLAEDVTESRKTERELQESERRFRQLAENIHEVFWVVENTPRQVLYISPAYEQIWGRSCQSLYAEPHSFLDAVHPGDRSRLISGMVTVSEGKRLDIEYRIIRPDGSIRWIRDRGFPVKDESGKTYRITGVATDITDRRRAEEALRETNETLRALIHASPLAIFTLDPQGRVKMWNPAAERIFGWSEPEILDHPLPILSNGPEPDEDVLQKSIGSGKGFTGIEVRRRRKDGSVIDLSISIAPLPGVGQTMNGMVAVVADISDRKKTEEALRKSDERFHLATRATNDAVWDWDLIKDLVWWNENFYTFFGYKPAEVEPGVDSWINRIHPEDKVRVEANIQKVIDSGEQFWSDEYRFRRGDGSYATLLDRGYVVRDPAGRAVRMIGAMMDITERKQAEEALRIKTQQLAAVTDAMAAYLDSRDWMETSSRLLRSALSQTESEYGFIGVVIEGPRLRVMAREGVQWDAAAGHPFYQAALQSYREQGYIDFDRLDNLFGEVVRTGKVVLSNDAANDARAGNLPSGHPPLQTFLGVPIIRENQVVGMIGLANRLRGYSAAEQGGIEILSHATGILYDSYRQREREIALENLQRTVESELRRSQEELRSLSGRLNSMVEEERTRISREIHDELGQQLTILKMELSWLKRRIPKKPELLRQRTKSMAELVDTTIRTLRKISTELRPGVLDDLGLTAAIEWQIQEFQSRTRIKCHFTREPEEITLDPERSTAVFRIFQETLTNIARHANADEARIYLEKNQRFAILKVSDNGRGITENQKTHSKSLGLLGMRERARHWGGTVEICGSPGEGTTLTVQIPLHQKADSREKND